MCVGKGADTIGFGILKAGSRALLTLLPLAGAAEGLMTVGRGEFADVSVPASTSSTLDGRILQHADGALYKSGAGLLTVPTTSFSGSAVAELRSVGGEVKVVPGTAADPVAVPSWLAAKAVLWFDVSQKDAHPELFVGATSNDTDYVDRWYDVRETNPAAPAYRYLQANVFTNHCGLSPAIARPDGKAMMYFGGYGSGRFYDLMQAGAIKSVTWKHAFFVHRVDNGFGFLFGTGMHISGYMNAATSLSYPAWSSLYTRALQKGYVYVNDKPFDGHAKPIPRGLQVLDVSVSTPLNSFSADSVFRDRDLFSAQVGYRAGGDYLGELIVFGEPLSENERVELAAYLNNKWRGVSATVATIDLACGARAVVEASSVSADSVALAGNGSVRKTGTGTVRLDRRMPGEFRGELAIEEGAVDLHAADAVRVAAGQKVTAAAGTDAQAAVVSVASACVRADALVKAGKAGAFVRALPAVNSLKVEEGTLTILPKTTVSGGEASSVRVTIPNASFETWDDQTNFEQALSDSKPFSGWYGTASVSMFDYSRWPANEKGVEASRSAWGLVQPKDGTCALFIRHGSWKDTWHTAGWTYVDIPVPGTYEFSCQVSGRGSSGYLGTPLDVLLIDEQGGVTNRLGRVRYLKLGDYADCRIRGRVAGSGRHQLRLVSLTDSYDRGIVLDRLGLRLVPEADRESRAWPVPGGTFEDAVFETGTSDGANVASFKSANTVSGWTFTQPEGLAGDQMLGVGLATPVMDNCSWFNPSFGVRSGFVQLFFNSYKSENASSATTTFVPPAGTYWLQADLAGFEGVIRFAADLTIGETTVHLGNDLIENRRPETHRWGPSFTVDGTQAVTLKLIFTNTNRSMNDIGGLWLDNVALLPVSSPDVEYVAGGDFETQQANGYSPAGWTVITRTGNLQCNLYGTVASAFGSDVHEGKYYLLIGNQSEIYQTVQFPERGIYRLTYHSHDRLSAGYAGNVLRSWLICPDGTTNVIGRSSNAGAGFSEHVFLFEVPEAGNYALGLCGERTTGAWSPAYETLVDGVSVRRVPPDQSLENRFPNERMRVSVADGSFLNLNFTGTNRVGSVRHAGTPLAGVVDAKTAPSFVNGPGALEIVPTGMSVLLK